MREALKTLSCLVERTLQIYEHSANRIQFTRVALDCNADYGDVFVAVDSSTSVASNDILFSEGGEEFYSFGDWAVPDVSETNGSIKDLWEVEWAPYQRKIIDHFLDLPEIEFEILKKNLLDDICRSAADLSKVPASLQIPILMADHDENIRHTTARLRWVYMGAPSAEHRELSEAVWRCRSKLHEGDELIMFGCDGQFVNGIVMDDKNEVAPFAEGDWSLVDSHLTLTTTNANFEDDGDILWKDLQYQILTLDAARLVYSDADGTQYEFTRGGL
jgi:hypothetical protein